MSLIILIASMFDQVVWKSGFRSDKQCTAILVQITRVRIFPIVSKSAGEVPWSSNIFSPDLIASLKSELSISCTFHTYLCRNLCLKQSLLLRCIVSLSLVHSTYFSFGRSGKYGNALIKGQIIVCCI